MMRANMIEKTVLLGKLLAFTVCCVSLLVSIVARQQLIRVL